MRPQRNSTSLGLKVSFAVVFETKVSCLLNRMHDPIWESFKNGTSGASL